jgi:hypothetical protein
MTTYETDRLAELVRRKHLCLTQLRDLGRQQCDVVEQGDVNDLLRILGAKQLLITSMQEVERALDPFRQQDPESRVWRSSTDREACAVLVADCERIYRSILEQERESEGHLRRRRDSAAERLAEARAADEVRGAYSPAQVADHSSLDLTSEVH